MFFLELNKDNINAIQHNMDENEQIIIEDQNQVEPNIVFGLQNMEENTETFEGYEEEVMDINFEVRPLYLFFFV